MPTSTDASLNRYEVAIMSGDFGAKGDFRPIHQKEAIAFPDHFLSSVRIFEILLFTIESTLLLSAIHGVLLICMKYS